MRVCFFLLLCSLAMPAEAKKCTGDFVNPISDIHWSCLFPITIGSFEIIGSDLKDTKNPGSPICVCPRAGIPVPGIVGGFWEPVRLVDVTPEPYCFPNLGGIEIPLGFDRGQGGRPTASSAQISRWHVHYYQYPIIAMLELFTDFICLQESQFDVLMMSELDPTASDDDLASLLNPEVFIFNNVVAQAACSADCTSSSTTGRPIDSLFWCAGCQGSMYPLSTTVNAHVGAVQASVNAAEKMTFKMHRLGLAHEASSPSVTQICQKRLAFMMKKSHYRYQMTNPDPDTCQPFGKTTITFESGKETPVVGEDFGYLIWRKKSCCIL